MFEPNRRKKSQSIDRRYFYCIFTTHRGKPVRNKLRQMYGLFKQNKSLYSISLFYEKRIDTDEDQTTQVKYF